MQTQESFSTSQFFKSRTGMVLPVFLAIATFFLITEHTVHFFGLLPYALLLLCPLLHLFMHGGHGGHSDHNNQAGHAGHTDEKQQPVQGGKS
jgi:hypothetical protein